MERGQCRLAEAERRLRRRRLQAILLILTVGFIWAHSLVPASVSDQESRQIATAVSPILESAGVENVSARKLNHPLRKLAHFAEFAALGFQLCLLCERKGRRSALRAMECGCLAAFIDETLQLFTPGRSGELRDVWLDASGVLAGILTALLLLFLLRRGSKTETE